MTWFYTHCVIAIVIVIADARGTFEPTVKDWEKRLRIPVPEEQGLRKDRLQFPYRIHYVLYPGVEIYLSRSNYIFAIRLARDPLIIFPLALIIYPGQ